MVINKCFLLFLRRWILSTMQRYNIAEAKSSMMGVHMWGYHFSSFVFMLLRLRLETVSTTYDT